MACAANSFPVPLSPSISTLAEEGATCRIVSSTSCKAAESPQMFSSPYRSSTCCRSARFSCSILRLGDKIVSAAFHRFDRDVDRAIRRHHDTDGRTRHFQSAIDQLHSIFASEAKIGEEHVYLLAFKHVHRSAKIGGDIDVIIVLEQTPQPVAGMLFIINNEDCGLWTHLTIQRLNDLASDALLCFNHLITQSGNLSMHLISQSANRL